MPALRSLLFYIIAFIPTAIFCVTGLVCLLLPRRVLVLYNRLWLHSVFFVLRHVQGLTYSIEGRENLPNGPFIISCKHQSVFETFMFPVLIDHPYIILKKELASVPFWGWMLKKYDAITIDRKKPKEAFQMLLQKGEETKTNGRPLLIFPEGTRTPPGVRGDYKPGIAILYDHLKIPVVPMAVNTGVFWPKHSFIKKPGHATLRILPAIQPGLSKREFMTTLENVIESACDDLLNRVKD